MSDILYLKTITNYNFKDLSYIDIYSIFLGANNSNWYFNIMKPTENGFLRYYCTWIRILEKSLYKIKYHYHRIVKINQFIDDIIFYEIMTYNNYYNQYKKEIDENIMIERKLSKYVIYGSTIFSISNREKFIADGYICLINTYNDGNMNIDNFNNIYPTHLDDNIPITYFEIIVFRRMMKNYMNINLKDLVIKMTLEFQKFISSEILNQLLIYK